MTPKEAAAVMPSGTWMQFASYPGTEGFYPCNFVPNVVYAQYDKEYSLQIIKPEGHGTKYPLVVYIQGSGWAKQPVFLNIPQLCFLASQGFVVAVVEYRTTETAHFPAPIEDAKTAIRFLRAHADTYGIDKERVAVWGDSSGGHVALMTGMTPGEYQNGLYPEETDQVNAIVDFFGITDILTLGEFNDCLDHNATNSPEALLLGAVPQTVPELAKKASPLYHIQPQVELPPVLVVHGDEDHIVHISQSIRFVQALRNAHKDVTFVKVNGGDHGFGVWGKRRLGLVAQFLTAHLKRPALEKPLTPQQDTL